MKRGQAAVEYVVLIGILLLFLVPMIQFSLIQTYTELKLTQLENSFNRLAGAVDAIGALSIGAQEIVTITLPSGIEEPISFSKKAIEVNFTIYGNKDTMGYITKVPVQGNMPYTRGTYHLLVMKTNQDMVNVSLWNSS